MEMRMHKTNKYKAEDWLNQKEGKKVSLPNTFTFYYPLQMLIVKDCS